MQLLKNSGKSSAPKDKHRILLFKDIMLVAVLVLPSYSLYFTTAACWYYCACCYYYSSSVPTSYSHSKSVLFAVPKYSQGNFRVESLETYFDMRSEANDKSQLPSLCQRVKINLNFKTLFSDLLAIQVWMDFHALPQEGKQTFQVDCTLE